MEPLRSFLNRIRWHPELASGTYELGVYDRVQDAVVRVPLDTVRFEPGNAFAFFLENVEGQTLTVPLHRVRAVYRDGELVWSR